MKQGLTEIVLILDRSGSMNAIQKDMEGGLNELIEEQKKLPGEAVLTFVKFDNHYDLVYSCKPINEVRHITLEPRGTTALFDAIGRTVASVGERLHNTPEHERPEKVIVAIITDGQENDSHEYTDVAAIKDMIEHQKEKYSWDFVFLGANQDAILTAKSFGIDVGKTLDYMMSPAGVRGATQSFIGYVGQVRCCNDMKSVNFTDQDREDAMED